MENGRCGVRASKGSSVISFPEKGALPGCGQSSEPYDPRVTDEWMEGARETEGPKKQMSHEGGGGGGERRLRKWSFQKFLFV